MAVLLVNITAGPDLTIGEFSKIGEMMHEFAGNDAVVVVGSAVDETMQGELRVTMVATGLGDSEEEVKAPEAPKLDKRAVAPVRNTPKPEFNTQDVGKTRVRQAPVLPGGPSRNNFDGGTRVAGGGPDYSDLDVPAFIRNQQAD